MRVVVKKSSETIALLEKALNKHFLFSCLEPSEIMNCLDVMFKQSVDADEDIVVQGAEGKEFYVLESGFAEVFVDGQKVTSYEPGGSFGELALVYNAPRAATVRAATQSVLWYIKLRDFRQLLVSAASGTMLKRCEFLSRIPLLQSLSKTQISKLADALKRLEFSDGTYIIRQGETGDTFFLIESGKVCCTQYKSMTDTTEIPLLNLKEGDYFGEMALMLEEPRAAHCIAQGPVSCLCLSRTEFFSLLGPIQNTLQNNMRVRILKSIPLLCTLTDTELCRIADALYVMSFNDQECIISQGAHGSQFFVINEGMVKVESANSSSDEEKLMLGKGDYFGMKSIIRNEVVASNVIAVGRVDCLVLNRADFNRLLAPLMDVIRDEVEKRDMDMGLHTESEKMKKRSEDHTLDKLDTPVQRESAKIEFSSLQVIKTLGMGTFGRVKLVKSTETGECYALKCMLKIQLAKSFQAENVLNEKNILFSCDHPFILHLITTYNTQNEVFMLTELILGGELWTYIYKHKTLLTRTNFGGFTTETTQFYAAGLILILEYLHSRNIAYRDVKPENILVGVDGYVKCVDFGFAKYIPFMHKNQLKTKSFTICGTPDYLAPEIILSRGHDKGVDYWSLGCFVFELIVGRTPFADPHQAEIFKKAVRSDRYLIFPKDFDPNAEDLIRRLLRSNCAFRLGNLGGGTSDIINHPWFLSTEFNFNSVIMFLKIPLSLCLFSAPI